MHVFSVFFCLCVRVRAICVAGSSACVSGCVVSCSGGVRQSPRHHREPEPVVHLQPELPGHHRLRGGHRVPVRACACSGSAAAERPDPRVPEPEHQREQRFEVPDRHLGLCKDGIGALWDLWEKKGARPQKMSRPGRLRNT